MAEPAAPSPAGLFDVSGRVALVTGASSGLGQRAALTLARAGARVVGVARRAERLAEWRQQVEALGGLAHALPGDVSRRADLPLLAEAAARPFGPPQIVVHAAGLNLRQPAAEVTDEGWDRTQEVNLAAPFFLSRLLVPAMADAGWGRIVTFASLQSFRAFPGGLAYGAAKGGVAQLTRAMAAEWSGRGVNVNALCPGFFPTELTAPVFEDPDRAARNAAQTCIGRNGRPEDLDGPLLFLCSDASAYVTGQILCVDGGFTAR